MIIIDECVTATKISVDIFKMPYRDNLERKASKVPVETEGREETW